MKFDEEVTSYHTWLAAIENPGVQRRQWFAFLRGMSSVLNILGAYGSRNACMQYRPFLGREDLTPKQKDAIKLASDWQRVGKTLDKIIYGELSDERLSAVDAKTGKILVQQMYNHFRNIYYS